MTKNAYFCIVINMQRHIAYLLINHDCVIVPGFGAFVARYESAHCDGGIMLPPSRGIGFNRDITHDDGLLVASVARRHDLSYTKAKAAVAEKVGEMRRLLERDGEVAIERVGALRSDNDNMLHFHPYRMSTASMLYDGLPRVSAITLAERAAKASATSDTSSHRSQPDAVYIRIPRMVSKVAAAIVALLVIGTICTTSHFVDSSMITGHTSLASLFSPNVENVASDSAAHGQNALCVEESMSDNSNDNTTSATQETSSPDAPSSPEEYCVVVASMKTMNGARKFIASTGDTSLQVLAQDGRYRVYGMTASTEDEAKAIASDSSLQKKYPGAWVTKK